jgi:hypothetical protein
MQQYLEVDGQQLPIASLLRKGTAIAIDISLCVAMAAMCFGLVSWFMPLDDPQAKGPIGVVVFVAMAYVVFGRDRIFSPGRRLLRLKLTKLPGRVSSLFSRSVSVHIDPVPSEDNSPLAFSVCLIGFATIAAGLALAASLSGTHVFAAVHEYVQKNPSAVARNGQAPVLSSLPRALLISKTRGYVQVSAAWGESKEVFDFYLKRAESQWTVVAVEPTKQPTLGNYSLGALDKDIPTKP